MELTSIFRQCINTKTERLHTKLFSTMLSARRRIFKKSDDNLQILLFWRPLQETSNIRNQPFSRTEHLSTDNNMELVEVVAACERKLKQI